MNDLYHDHYDKAVKIYRGRFKGQKMCDLKDRQLTNLMTKESPSLADKAFHEWEIRSKLGILNDNP